MQKRNFILSLVVIGFLTLIGAILFAYYQTQTPKAQVNSQPKPTPQPHLTGQILFVSDQTENYDIYSMDLATKKITNLTDEPGSDMNPQLSPDGSEMVFYSNRDGSNQIYKMNLETQSLTQLTKNKFDNYDPSYSPDGSKIVYKSTQDEKLGDIFIMNADGSKPINLTPKLKNSEEWDPTFSQDGQKIIFVSRKNNDHLSDELFVMNKDGSNITQITKNQIPDWYPSVNPKNGSIAYISKRLPNKADDIYLTDSTGKTKTVITSSSGNDADPSWSLKGDKIIFINDSDGDYDLYMMNSDGGQVQKILDTPADELSPIFRAD